MMMNNTKGISLVFFVSIIFLCSSLLAQFSGSVQTSYQLGNLPDAANSNRSNLYNQLNLHYNQNNLTLGLRMENYVVDEEYEYNRLSQKYLRYQTDDLEVTIGNFYEILGRGVLLRGYEIPGSIYEHGAYRQRYGFYKDIEGILLRFSNEYIQAKLLHGRPLNNFVPPAFSNRDRRMAIVQGGEVNLTALSEFQPGALYLRSESSSINEFGGFNVQGFFESGAQYYLEYTQDLYDPLTLNNTAHGLYASFSYGWDLINATLEYKDYNKYALGFNDPPLLSREHSYTLINRSIHPGEPQNETGYQVEFLVNTGDFNTVTLNHSQTTNEFFSVKYNFYEYYADVNYYLNENWVTKLFIDYADDELPPNERDRITVGGASEDKITDLWSYNLELQYQMFERRYPGSEFNNKVTNLLLQGALNHSPDLSLSISFEKTKDPLLSNSDKKNWIGYNMSYQYNQNNTLSLFYGARRGGNSCVGGICYQIQPFKGIEFRLSSRF